MGFFLQKNNIYDIIYLGDKNGKQRNKKKGKN